MHDGQVKGPGGLSRRWLAEWAHCILAIVVGVATSALVVAALVGRTCEDAAGVKHHPDLSQSEFAAVVRDTLLCFALSVSISGPVAIWLLVFACTPHLSRVAQYATLVWLGMWLFCAQKIFECWGSDSVGLAVGLLGTLVWCVAGIAFLNLLYHRLRALEASFFQHVGSSHMRRAIIIMALIVMVAVSFYYLAKKKPLDHPIRKVAGVVFWAGYFSYTAAGATGIRVIVKVLGLAHEARHSSSCRGNEQVKQAPRALRMQLVGTILGMFTTSFSGILEFWKVDCAWPLPGPPEEWRTHAFWVLTDAGGMLVDAIFNSAACLTLSGAVHGALRSGRVEHQAEVTRQTSWRQFSEQWTPEAHKEWQDKVTELASRCMTLQSIVDFYRDLDSVMTFDPARSTTEDVVRQAIIPLSAENKCSLAEMTMEGAEASAHRMVTHSWSNRFSNLVAAIVADALHEREYAMIAYLLAHDIRTLQDWITKAGVGSSTYWVCIFCVNQHSSICDNTQGRCDTVTGQPYATCSCNLPKAGSHTQPLFCGRSVPCEMNKFDPMMLQLSASSPNFAQVVVVDSDFVVFRRAWCVAEIAAASEAGMQQGLKLTSQRCLEANREQLTHMNIKDMEASRPEDKEEILARIQDLEGFNRRLKSLLLDRLIPSWARLDAFEQMLQVGRVARWQLVSRQHGPEVWTIGNSLLDQAPAT